MMAGGLGRAVALGVGWGVGTGVVVLAMGALGGGVRPVLKGAIRGGVTVAERARMLTAEGAEVATDLYHEVVEEREAERTARDAVRHGAGGDLVVFGQAEPE